MAKIVTRQDRANAAAESILRFRDFRPGSYWEQGWPHLNPPLPPAKETYERLIALGEKPDPDEVERIVARPQPWTLSICDECGEYKGTMAEFDINCGEYAVEICANCCRKLATEIDNA